MSDLTVLGVDPGGKWTGMVLRAHTGDVIVNVLGIRDDDEPIHEYGAAMRETLFELGDGHQIDAIALEGLTEPNPHMGMINVGGLLDTAVVYGAIGAWPWPVPVYIVEPGGHGSAPLAAYPGELIGEREKKGTGVLKHCRSAWDIAGVGCVMHRAAG
jgi:hypothetical protein